MTAEQIRAMKDAIEEAERANQPVPEQRQTPQVQQQAPEPEPISFQYNGQTYQVRSAEELQARIDQIKAQEESQVQAERIRLQAEANRAAEEAANQNSGNQPKFDKEEYANLFLKDPVAADAYLEQFSPTRQAVIQRLQSKVVELEQTVSVQQFLNANPDYEPNAESFNKLHALMQQYNLPWNFQGLSLAYVMGKTNGQFQVAEPEQVQQPQVDQSQANFEFDEQDPEAVSQFLAQRQQQARVVPPSLPRGKRAAAANEQAQYLDRFENLTADQMKDIILKMQ